MRFELYKPRSTRNSNPSISISKYGRITVNKSAIEQYFKSVSHVRLYFDKQEGVIGIEPTGKDDAYALKLGYQKHAKSRLIVATGFLNRYNILPDKLLSCSVEWDEELDMMVAKIPVNNKPSDKSSLS